jgi:soluble lytic murein transglycosylase
MSTDLFDARTNLQAGTWYLRRALDRWRETDDPVVFALADYSAGPDAVRRWSGDERSSATLLRAIDLPETQRFVDAVREKANGFRNSGL